MNGKIDTERRIGWKGGTRREELLERSATQASITRSHVKCAIFIGCLGWQDSIRQGGGGWAGVCAASTGGGDGERRDLIPQFE